MSAVGLASPGSRHISRIVGYQDYPSSVEVGRSQPPRSDDLRSKALRCDEVPRRIDGQPDQGFGQRARLSEALCELGVIGHRSDGSQGRAATCEDVRRASPVGRSGGAAHGGLAPPTT